MINEEKMTFSHSRIECFKQCPVKYKYKYIDKLEPLGSDGDALNIGKAVHYGIEHESSDKALEYMDEEKLFSSEKDETNKALVLAMVDSYLLKWNGEIKIHEKEFRLPITDNIELLGYIDSIIEEEEGYFIEEIKTASMINKDYIDKLSYIDQPTKYMLAIDKLKDKLGLKPDKSLLGIKYRVIRKPTIRQKQAETIDQFRKRLVEKFNEESDDYLFEFILTRTPEQIEECLDDIIQDIQIITNTNRFVRNCGSCMLYMKRCPYMELCMNMEGAQLLYNKKEERKEDENVTEE